MAVKFVGVARPPLTWQPEAAAISHLGNKVKNASLEALVNEGLEKEKGLRMDLEEAIRRLAKKKGWRVS
jgi:hypothetical protein